MKGKRFLEAALEMLYPASAGCVCCRQPFEHDGQDDWLCPECLSKLKKITPPLCRRCGRPLEDGRCGQCAFWPDDVFSAVCSRYLYVPPMKEAVWAFKYRGLHAMGEWLGDMVAEMYADEQGYTPDLIIPVPMNRKKQRNRGYNQSEILAAQVSRRTGIRYENALERTRATRNQAGLSGAERATNVLGAFSCKRDLSGMRVDLLDDVLTTGATALECARMLLSAGALSVRLVTLTSTPSGISRNADV